MGPQADWSVVDALMLKSLGRIGVVEAVSRHADDETVSFLRAAAPA